jgi:hypothetical protein
MFLIVQSRQELASWDGADSKTKPSEANSEGYFTASQKEERHEYDTSIKNVLIDLYWQMDTQNFVFA